MLQSTSGAKNFTKENWKAVAPVMSVLASSIKPLILARDSGVNDKLSADYCLNRGSQNKPSIDLLL